MLSHTRHRLLPPVKTRQPPSPSHRQPVAPRNSDRKKLTDLFIDMSLSSDIFNHQEHRGALQESRCGTSAALQ